MSDLLSFNFVDVFVRRSEDGVSYVIFLQHEDRHALHLRPILRQERLMSEQLDFGPQLQLLRSALRISFFLLEGIYWRTVLYETVMLIP